MANELYVSKLAAGDVVMTGSTAAFTQNLGVYIPAGAVVTGLRYVAANTAVVIAAAEQTVVAKVGTQAIGAALAVSDFPAQTVGLPNTLATTSGVIVTAGGQLNAVGGATGGDTASGTWTFYVDYLYVPE